MRSHPECFIFHTARVCVPLTGLLFCMRGCRLLINSHIGFYLLTYLLLNQVEARVKIIPKDPGPLKLSLYESFAIISHWW